MTIKLVDKSIHQVNGYNILTEKQQQLFERTYAKHIKSMGAAVRSQYTINKIKRIRFDPVTICLKVYFKNGNWWHYDQAGDWY